MDIRKLEIENFLTIGTAELELDNRGLILIQGENRDDTSADSNGAGKSSIVDAICWGIYGTTARGVSGDSIVNNKSKKNCKVVVEIDDEGTIYRIERYRKHATHKNALYITSTDDTGVTINLSKGTDRDTQEVINKVMGCTLDVFVAAIYAGQEQMPDLPGMTDKNLKMLIEEAAGVEVLTEAYTVARTRLTNREKDLTAVQTSVASLTAQHDTFVDSLATAMDQRDTFETERKARARAEIAKADPIKVEIDRMKKELEEAPVAKINAAIAKINEVLDGRKAKNDELKKLRDAQSSASLSASNAKTLITSKKNQIARAENELASIDSQVGKPCGECGKTYEEHDLATARLARLETLRELHAELVTLEDNYSKAEATLKQAQTVADTFESTLTDVTDLAKKHRELSGRLSAVNMLERSIESKAGDLKRCADLARAKMSEPNPHLASVTNFEAKVNDTAAKLETVKKTAEEIEKDVDLLRDAVKVFGPAGVRAHILDTVTPYLNDRTSDYLGALSDGNIHAVWSTLSKTAKGELREKFNIEVTNDKGADSFSGLSGGEKRKARLAAAMALQDMVASRAAKPINIFIADEVDHALDESGLERLMGVLDRKARERGTVLVISHNSLRDWIDTVVTVTKESGITTVSGDTIRTF